MFPTLHVGSNDGGNGKGPVHSAQWLLAGHNAFKEDFKPGTIDGIYGAQTGEAAKRAKWLLGYPPTAVDSSFGPVLYDYLTARERLPDSYRSRRNSRLRNQSPYIFPLKIRHPLIGFPGQGTHSWIAKPNNWESDNAWDISCPENTPLIAMADGVIGSQIGYISTDPNSRFGGMRFHLIMAHNEAYYAHANRLTVHAGQHVKQGDVCGFSGKASGVPHLHIGFKDWSAVRRVIEGR